MIFVLLMLSSYAQWNQIDAINFDQPEPVLNGWKITKALISQCSSNNEQFLVLNNQDEFLEKTYKLHVQAIQVILNVQFDFPYQDTTQQSQITISFQEEQMSATLYHEIFDRTQSQFNYVCTSNNQNSPAQSKPLISQIQQITSQSFSIKIQFNNYNSGNQLKIKSILVQGYFCPPYCKSCTVDTNTCNVCYSFDGQNQCKCPSTTPFYQDDQGCLQECQRDKHWLAYLGSTCLYDNRIAPKFQFMSASEGVEILPTNFNPQHFVTFQKSQFYGYFTNTQISIKLGTFQDQIQLIRIRMDLLLFNFLDQSILEFYLNNQLQARIQYNSQFLLSYASDRQHSLSKWIYLINYPTSERLARIELVFQNLMISNPNFIILGSTYGTSQWAFSNLTVDVSVCKSNCQICLDSYTCIQCKFGYFLYQSECVQSCPIHTTNCIDYELEIPVSSYLVKSFYNSNMTLDEIKSHYDFVVNSNNNPLSGQLFSFINNKIVLGGLLVWNSAKFTKTYTISAAHYAISLRFNITFGDDFSGTFNYYIDYNSQQSIIRTSSLSDKNLIGKSSAETIQFVYNYFTHSSGTLKIEFECLTSYDIKDGFCAISEYFIVVHKCVPPCQSCTSLEICTSGTTAPPCLAPSFWLYQTSSSQYICTDCTLSNCLQCVNNLQCKACTFESNNKYSLDQGQCICDSKYQRKIIYEQCQCINGYYDDPLNYNCYSICGDQIAVQDEECDDGNLIPFDGCHQCRFQCQMECSICIKGQCWKCQQGYALINEFCYPICDIIPNQYPCSIDKLTLIQQALKDISCPENKQIINSICQSVCGDGFRQKEEECDNNKDQYLTLGCQNCQCQEGYKAIEGICFSICGDGIKSSEEECDDENIVSLDGCSQFCLKECVNCNIGYCKAGMCSKCNSGYYTDFNQQCTRTQCGDQIIIEPEQCDDGNLVINDGCSDCLCELGWQSTQNRCQSICGDGLIVKGEQCDDGNNIQYDGCHNCKYDCNKECEICDFGHCQKCKYGFNLINNNCINTCGDGILNRATEECDDNNNLPRDGCYNCKLEQGFLCFDYNLIFKGCQRCSDTNCQNCILENNIEKCQICESSYYLNEKQECLQCDEICIDCIKTGKNCINYNYNIYQLKVCDNSKGLFYNFELRDCISLCGDGIIQGNEQCDDKNIDDFDGCSSQCQIEKGYLLDLETKQIINEPNVKVEFQLTNNFQYSIKADQYQEAIDCTAILISIELFNQTDFNYTTQESDSNCNLEIQYFKSIELSNLIHIFVAFKQQYKKRLIQELGGQSIQEIVVVPRRQPYASQEQKEQGQKVADVSNTISKSLVVLGPMAILAGGFKFIWAILDILSWLNNFYFLNVTYPENVRQIFLQAEWSNIIDFPSINYFNNPDDLYYFQAPLKFSEKGIDPLFFNNIQTIIFFIFQIIITKIFCYCFIRIMKCIYKKETQNHSSTKLQTFKLGEGQIEQFTNDNTQNLNRKQQILVPKIFESFYKKCSEFEQCFLTNLLKTIQISFLDLILAIVLQISNQETSNFLVVKVNTIIAYIMMAVLFYILYFSYQISITHKLQLESKCFSMRYNSFYEDINTDSNLAMLYSFINLVRKTMFIVSTVVFYYQPIYQTFFCFMSSFLNIFILVQHNPFKKKQQYLLNFVPDFGVFIVTAIAVIFAFQDAFLFFEEELIYKLGWVIVGFIYLSIAIQLLFFIKQFLEDLREKFQFLINYCKQKCCQSKLV